MTTSSRHGISKGLFDSDDCDIDSARHFMFHDWLVGGWSTADRWVTFPSLQSNQQDSQLTTAAQRFTQISSHKNLPPSKMSLAFCRNAHAARHPKRVSFTPYVEINEFQPLDSGLKSTLYYSRDEITDIQNQLRQAIVMRRKRLLMEKMEQELRGSPCFQECLQRHSGAEKRASCYDGGAALPLKKARHI